MNEMQDKLKVIAHYPIPVTAGYQNVVISVV